MNLTMVRKMKTETLFPILTNKEFQALGKVSRVVVVYLLGDDGERIRRLPIGSEEHSKFNPSELEVVKSKVQDKQKLFLDLGECLF